MIDSPVAGDLVYVESATGSGVFTIASFSSPNIFTFEPQFWNGSASLYGYINLDSRTNYFINTRIYGVDESNSYYFIGTSENKPDASGRVDIDVSSFLKESIGYVNEFQYDVINKQDLTQGGSFNITSSENWQLYEGPYSAISNTVLRFFVNAAKQIQDLYGSNMGEYVPFYILTTSPEIDDDALFLSDFEKPTYFPNFPFDLSFIYSESLAGIVTTREEETFDVNGISVSTSSTELNNAEVQDVNRLMIEESYAAGIEEVDVWLDSEGTVDCVRYMASGYVVIGYVADACGLPVISDDPVSGGVLTDPT